MRPSFRPIAAYILLAYGLAWLVCLPLLLDSRGLSSPLMLPTAVVMMATPTAATLVVLRFGERKTWRQIATQLRLGIGGSPARLVAFLGVAAGMMYLFVFGALLTSSLLGQFDADPGLSGLQALLAGTGQQLPAAVPPGAIAVVLVASALANGVLNTIPALGEELGWRGFLFPQLQQQWGTPAALVGTGIIWGLWHAPLILLGYNYPLHPVLGLLAFCVVCTLLNAVLAWVTERSGSIWPAAYGHGVLNALASLAAVLFLRAGSEVDFLHATILGWSGWFIPAAVVGVLLATKSYRTWKPAMSPARQDSPSPGPSVSRSLPPAG